MIRPEDGAAIHPRSVNHVGISIPDLAAAIDWYGKAFDFHCIMGPRILTADSAATAETSHVLGPRFARALQAHLMTANGVGLELFEFQDPPMRPASPTLDYNRPGIWHVCFTERDVAGAARRVSDLGGTQLSPVVDFVPGRPFRLVYCSDPWGTTIEVMSHSYAEVFANWPHAEMAATTSWATPDAVGNVPTS